MPIVRYYSQLPDLAEIQKIEGPIIVENPGGATAGVNVGVPCLIGETLKGPANVPTLCSPADVLNLFGGFSPYVGDGAAYKYDGNAFVALAGGQKFGNSIVVVSVDDAVGLVSLTRKAPGYASLTSSSAGPFALTNAGTIIVAIEGPVTDGTVTIHAAAASSECANAETYDLSTVGNRTLTIAVNGGAAQSATITTGDVVAIGAVTAEELSTWINAAYTALSSAPSSAGTKVTVSTDRKGLSASLQFGGAMRSVVGFTASLVQASQSSSVNNVQDVDAVTVDELVTLAAAQLSDVTPSNVGGFLRFTRNIQGNTGTLALSGTLPGAGSGAIAFPSLSATGGTGTALAGVLPAGFRVSDGGSNVFFLGEDVAFAVDVLTASGVRIKQASGTTVSAAAIDTVIDTPPTAIVGLTVTNAAGTTAKPTTESGWLTLYTTAITSLLAAQAPASTVNLVALARHGVKDVAIGSLTGSLQKALLDHCTESTANGRPRMAFVSPPPATPKATARGSSGVGVASTTAGSRNKLRAYCWPGSQKYVQEIVLNDPTLDGIVDWPMDVATMALASRLAPYLSLSEPGGNLSFVLDLESYYTADGVGLAFGDADYITNKASGIASLRIDTVNGPVIQSQVSSVDPATDPDNVMISDTRSRHWWFMQLVNIAAPKQSKLATPTRRRGLVGDIKSLIANGVELEQIEDGVCKESTPDALKGRGIIVLTVGVRLLDHFDNIIFSVTIGRTVDVKAL
jgi:hypothetical protein